MAGRKFRTRESYQRRGPTREPYDAVLIVCEGQKTEPLYFEGLKAEYRLSSANIAIEPMGRDPLSLVRYAIAELERDDALTRAYCVFDRDGHATFNEAINKAKSCAYGQNDRLKLAVSVPCFEVWPLLHFSYSTAPIVGSHGRSPGERAMDLLRQEMPVYSKNDRGVFDKLSPHLPTAFQNARKLAGYNQQSAADNPSTSVHRLVEYLIRLNK